MKLMDFDTRVAIVARAAHLRRMASGRASTMYLYSLPSAVTGTGALEIGFEEEGKEGYEVSAALPADLTVDQMIAKVTRVARTLPVLPLAPVEAP